MYVVILVKMENLVKKDNLNQKNDVQYINITTKCRSRKTKSAYDISHKLIRIVCNRIVSTFEHFLLDNFL